MRIPSYDDLTPSIPDITPRETFSQVKRFLPRADAPAPASPLAADAFASSASLYACLRADPSPDSDPKIPSPHFVIARDFSPRVERHGGSSVVLDVSGLGRLLGDPQAIGDALDRAAAGSSTSLRIAIARTQTAARLLAIGCPGLRVGPGEVAAAIAPLPIIPGYSISKAALSNMTQSLRAVLAAEAVTVQNDLSSAHITFIDDAGAAQCEQRGWLIRDGIQYHWFNRDYSSFDDFLAALTSRRRKTLRKERAAAREGLTFRTLRGAEIGAAEWDAMWAFYQDTGSRKWGQPYLTRGFFDLVGERMGDQLLLFLAYRAGRPIAGALNFVGSDTLYGRYWGTIDEVPFLHFELCLYQAIEWAIEHRLMSVQAGAQGEHKVARGYEPVITKSAHFIANRSFRSAVTDFVEAEQAVIASEVELLRRDLPYRSSSSE